MPSFDQLFGKIAVDRGFVSPKSLQEAILRQAQGEPRLFLGEMLLQMGCMSEGQVAEVLTAQGLEEEFRGGHIPFGEMALRNRLLSAVDLKRGLKLQEESAKTGGVRRIGEILVDQKSLSSQETDAVLQRQQILRRKKSKSDITKRHRPLLIVSLLLSLLSFTAASFLGFVGVLRPLNNWFYDALHLHRPASKPIPEIAVVYVGDRDIAKFREKLGRWPWRNRRPHQAALEILTSSGAKQIGVDLLFTEASLDTEKSDHSLAEAMAAADGIVNACVFYTEKGRPAGMSSVSEKGIDALKQSGGSFGIVPQDTQIIEGHGIELPVDTLLEASPFVGHINAFADPDGVIRKAPLFLRYGDKLYPSLALRLALMRLGVSADQVSIEPGKEVKIAVPGRGILRIPVDRRCFTRINFEHRVLDYTGYQYTDLETAGRDAFAGKVVVVGIAATGSSDIKITPIEKECPGFLIHAAVLESLLTGRFVPSLEPDENPLGLVEVLVQLGILTVVLLLGCGMIRLPEWLGAALGFVLVATPFVLSSWLFLKWHFWSPPGTPALCLLSAGLCNIGYRQIKNMRERSRTREIYERYLSPQVLETVLKNPELLKVGGTRKEMTFFFSDIRGFTQHSESSEPEELTSALNEYFTVMTEIIHRHGGTLDKFVGDCIMVFFNDPIPQPDHAIRAVKMALDMRSAMFKLQKAWVQSGRKAFGAGMGIHTGYATVGNFGSDYFTNYTVIGNAVNLAARIEHESKANQILISARTYHLVKDQVAAIEVGLLNFKGISEKVEIWEVTGVKGAKSGNTLY